VITHCPHCGYDFIDGIYCYRDATILECYYPRDGGYEIQDIDAAKEPHAWVCPLCDKDVAYRAS